jgi:AcrR family transcriptional regulator
MARGRPSRRPQIIAATEKLLRTRGLASVTTKQIAAEVGCSEAALYVHFAGRSQLLLAVLEESLPDMLVPLRELEQAVGRHRPEQNLRKALRGIFAFQERVTPTISALFADPALLLEYRKSLLAQNKGPRGGIARLRKYITAEQKLGRIGQWVNAQSAAEALMAGPFFRSFTGHFLGQVEPFEPFARLLVTTVIGPTGGHPRR